MLEPIKEVPNPDNLPKISQTVFNQMLEKHAMFMTGQLGGQRLSLYYSDLSGINFHNHDLSQADFTGSRLVGADLSLGMYKHACFFGCDLTGADLSHADFTRADMRGSCLSGANLSGANLADADMREGKIMEQNENGALIDRERSGATGSKTVFRGARLNNANLSGVRASSADFSNADMTRSTTEDAQFTGASFEGANLSDVDFSNSDLSHTNMQNAILSGTQLDHNENLNAASVNAITEATKRRSLENPEKVLKRMIDRHVLWIDSHGQDGEQLDLHDYDLRNLTDLRFFTLTAINAAGACFISLDLSETEMQSALLERADFRDCYMENIDLRGSRLCHTQFTRANLRGARMSPLQFKRGDTLRLHRVDLSGADLRYANLEESDLRDAILMGADLTHANLRGADLRRADLTGAVLDRAVLDDAKLDKAIIDWRNI